MQKYLFPSIFALTVLLTNMSETWAGGKGGPGASEEEYEQLGGRNLPNLDTFGEASSFEVTGEDSGGECEGDDASNPTLPTPIRSGELLPDASVLSFGSGEDEDVPSGHTSVEVATSDPRQIASNELDDLMEDISKLIPSKTWWESWFGMDDERYQDFENLRANRALSYALKKLDNPEKLKVKGKRGAAELRDAILENKDQIRQKLIERQRTIQKDIRESHARRVSQIPQETRASASGNGGAARPWSWMGLGAYPEQSAKNRETTHPHSSVEDTEHSGGETKKEGTGCESCVECQARACIEKVYMRKVAQYLTQETPIEEWDHATARWFWQEGEGKEFQIGDTDDALPEQSEEEFPSSQPSHVASVKKFSAEDIGDLFTKQLQKYTQEDKFVGYWKLHIWDFFENNPKVREVCFSQSTFTDLSKKRRLYLKAGSYLANGAPGYVWQREVWEWFIRNGQDKVFCLQSSSPIKGADRISILQKSRVVPEEVKLNLKRTTPPNRWKVADWQWFEAHAKGTTIAGLHIDPEIYQALCEQRKNGESKSCELDLFQFPAIREMVRPEPRFTPDQVGEFVRAMQVLLKGHGKEIKTWPPKIVTGWDLDMVKWLLHEGRVHIFAVENEGGSEEVAVSSIDGLFERMVETYLVDPELSSVRTGEASKRIEWHLWDKNTAYWFEIHGKGRDFAVPPSGRFVVDDEVHRAFLMEKQWYPVIQGVFLGKNDFATLSDEAMEWFNENGAPHRFLHYTRQTPNEIAEQDEMYKDKLYGQAVYKYLEEGTPPHAWRQDIWDWLVDKWTREGAPVGKAEMKSGTGSEKILEYGILQKSSPVTMSETQYDILVEQRKPRDWE